ncbi:hypothetical protein [Streptomyces sp. NPDC127072]|uniref:hypothetical protein n=1 Tax=Streptomyces sp. NPDC127072 TaxID=3347129 RepID=UPI00364BCCD1
MPQHVPNTPLCRDCDGFATAAIATGARHRDGSRVTLRVTCTACTACTACKGTGHTVPASALVRAGR